MENAITAGLSQQIVLSRALDVVANNVANQTTAGYKSEKLIFEEFLVTAISDPVNESVSLVYDKASFTDYTPGGLTQTHSPLDFAINGPGFFAVQRGDEIAYTRDGRFQLNSFGDLVSSNGAYVLDENGAPIFIDAEQGPLVVGKNRELQQNGATIARLGVFTVDQAIALRVGDNQFSLGSAPIAQISRDTVQQGFLENSNVSPVGAMTEMIAVLRAYESAAQLVETSNDLALDAIRTLTNEA